MTCVKWRFIIAGMICLTCMINYIVRGNMSIIILAMTKPLYNTTQTVPDYGPRYQWSAYDQSLVLGSYSWGTVVVTFVAGVFSEKYGPRKVAGYALAFGTVLSALAPLAGNFLWSSIIIRFLTGISMGAISPSIQALIANWAPPEEKGKFLAITLSSGLGTVIDWSMSGFIIEYLGWQYAFYVVVIILGIHVIVWFCIVYDSPTTHPLITTSEKEFILMRLTATAVKEKKPWPPLKSMCLSLPIWALTIFHYGYLFSQYIFLTATPKYLSEVHHFTIAKTGVLSSIPYLTRFAFGIGFGFVGDFMFKAKILSPVAVRKWFSICSHFMPAFFLIGLSFAGKTPYLAVALMALALGVSGAISITTLQNPHDLSPNFAATIFAFINTFGSTSGFVVPLIVAHFTKEQSTDAEWRNVFLFGAGMLIGSALIFVIFGRASVQKWNETVEVTDETTEDILDKNGAKVGLIVYMAHVGSFVPTASATIGLFSEIFTRPDSDETLKMFRHENGSIYSTHQLIDGEGVCCHVHQYEEMKVFLG